MFKVVKKLDELVIQKNNLPLKSEHTIIYNWKKKTTN